MDITQLTQNLIKGLEQKNTDQLAALSRVLNIALGKMVMASVTETAPVTPQERQELLKQTLDALVQINKLANNSTPLAPAIKADIIRLLEQQTLIKSPELKWVSLLVNDRTLLTYSDKPLGVGQNIPVQLASQQKLVLLDLPEFAQANIAAKSHPSSTPAPQPLSSSNLTKLTTPQLLAELQKTISELSTVKNATAFAAPISAKIADVITLTEISNASTAFIQKGPTGDPDEKASIAVQQLKHVIADTLRQLLPHKDKPTVLYTALTQWQTIPQTVQQKMVSPSLEQALHSVAEKIRSPLQLSQPKELEQIVKNSGIFFENKLNSNLTSPNQTITPSSTKQSATFSNNVSQDLKGSLLNLVSKLTQEINGNNKPLTTEQTVKLLQQLSHYIPTVGTSTSIYSPSTLTNNSLPIDIGLLLNQLINKPIKELSDKEIRMQLLVLLQQHSLHGLAKIQLQQLTSLNHEIERKDSVHTNSSWQFDIPVKHHNEITELHLRIDRDWNDEKYSTNDNRTNTKVKQWSVTLRFDLPTLGEFCAQLAIVDNSVSATLWATQETTIIKVRNQVDDLRKRLESEGIQVKQLQCIKGMPPEKPLSLSYSLIDVST